MEFVFIARYYSEDKSRSWDLIIERHNLGLPCKYKFETSLLSLINFHGKTDLDLGLFYSAMHMWPYCDVFLRLGADDVLIFRGKAAFDHHGEPCGYSFY